MDLVLSGNKIAPAVRNMVGDITGLLYLIFALFPRAVMG
jgi:hypothetical protein